MNTATTPPPSSTLDPLLIKKDFPILHQKINGHPLLYLDNAATTQKPSAVINALTHYYENDNSNVHRGLHELSNRATEAYENARARVASFIKASTDEIIFTRGTTEAINLVAQTHVKSILTPGDIILTTEIEHHSNIVPWQILAEQTGAKLLFIPILPDTSAIDIQAAHSLIEKHQSKIKILSFTHTSNTLGIINPVTTLCELARKHGITTLIDAAQAAGHAPLDISEIACDFLAFSGHKACAPTGIGVLFGRKELLDHMPPYHGGGEMIDTVTFEKSTFKSAPHRFEAGTPNIAGAIGLHAAIDYLDHLGMKNITSHDHTLAAYAYQKLSQIEGIRILGPTENRASMITFTLNDIHAHDIVEMANQYGIALRGGHHCNQPLMKKLGTPATARASFYIHNTTEDIDRLTDTLTKIKSFFSQF